MIKGIDVNQRIEFVSKNDNSEPKTIFVFRPLTAESMLSFASEQNNGELKLTGSKIFDFLEMSIVEIKNYQEGSVNELLRTLPPMIIAELVQEAGNINKMNGQDEKN